jgi:type IX secretion system PorP/SprF family membrane protein
MLNKYRNNPAYAGLDFSLSATAVYRSQWAGIEGNPKTRNVNVHFPFYLINGAIGFNLENESLGAITNTLGTVSYSYVYESPIGLFAAGAKFGMFQKSLDGSKLRSPDGIYEGPDINHMDPNIPIGTESSIAPTWGIGAYYIHPLFEAGISIDNIISSPFNLGSATIDQKTYLNLYVESRYEFDNYFTLHPSIMIKSDFVETQISISSLIELNGKIFGGLGIRGYTPNTLDAVFVIAGWRFNEHYKLSYSYDIGLSSLRNVSEGSHEILLNYNLNRLIGAGLPPKIIYNPRFL